MPTIVAPTIPGPAFNDMPTIVAPTIQGPTLDEMPTIVAPSLPVSDRCSYEERPETLPDTPTPSQ